MDIINLIFILFIVFTLSNPVFKIIKITFYFIKNKIKPIKLPKYDWREVRLEESLNYEWGVVKFYATKNWVEIYVSLLGNLDDVDKTGRRLIIPKWKVISYGGGSMKLICVFSRDYERYKKWQK
ncbi:MAG: hypothetical protein J4472_02045 [DPANN group archaeon]|nr:hypothetical protein [DPANN group archaeon]